MLFNSVVFAIFFIIVFYVYWALRKYIKLQNCFVVAASYFFYGYWDWRFLGLIIFTSIATYTTGLIIQKSATKSKAKTWMWINIIINLAILGFFKYFNFFADNLILITSLFGIKLDWVTIDILLPIGISFYTFQAISYTIDVYKKKIEATTDISAFLSFIAFFPQLIAGPIERAQSLLPQFMKQREFDYNNAVIGMRQILWGLAKKILVADSCAHFADNILGDPEYYAGSSIIVAIFLFMFQAYGDYSGYSDIAIGLGRLLGIKLTKNFNVPLFSRSISEFWQRWNMTLMHWFRDYIYIPLGGSRKGTSRTCINILIVFLISGLWHGAGWTYIIWGGLNALCIFPAVLSHRKVPKNDARLKDIPVIILSFTLATFLIILFRYDSLADVNILINCISFDSGLWNLPTGKTPFFYIIPMLIIEWVTRKNDFALEKLPSSKVIRWGIYWGLLILLIYGTSYETQPYLYFQF